jgi:hypothetical protein
MVMAGQGGDRASRGTLGPLAGILMALSCAHRPQPPKPPAPAAPICFQAAYVDPGPGGQNWHMQSALRTAAFDPSKISWLPCQGDEAAVAYWVSYGMTDVTVATNSDDGSSRWLRDNGLEG